MSEKLRVLEMLAAGKIKIEEADALLDALGEKSNFEKIGTQTKKSPKFLCINIEPKSLKGDKVNVRIPFAILLAGVKLAALIPEDAKRKVNEALESKGIDIDFTKLNSQNINEFIDSLSELTVDFDSENDRIKIYCE